MSNILSEIIKNGLFKIVYNAIYLNLNLALSYVLIASLCLSCTSTSISPIQDPIIFKKQLLPEEKDNTPATKNIEVVEFNDIATITCEEPQKPPELMITQNNKLYTITPKKVDFLGGAVAYNYVPNHIYKIFLSPNNIVDLELEPGESLTSAIQLGDSLHFSLSLGNSRLQGVAVSHIFIQALRPHKTTTMTILTNRRSYQFQLTSYNDIYMPVVKFNYPDKHGLGNMQELEKAKRESFLLTLDVPITQINFDYKLIPVSIFKPAWAPNLVFDDGRKTYLRFPSAKLSSYSPVLLDTSDHTGRPEILNYLVVGDYYIINRIVKEITLAFDQNEGNHIKIIRK